MSRKLIVLLSILTVPLGGAGDAALDRGTLRGLGAVNVVIDSVPAEVSKEGATAQEFRNRLEGLLSRAGVKIDPASNDFVALRLISVHAPKGPFAISATLGLYQPVTLVRDAKVKTSTQTWEVDTIALADNKQVYRACMDSVDDLTQRFLAAYRSVNH